MRVDIRSKNRENKKATRRAYGESRKNREAAVFEHRLEAQWRDHRPIAV